MRIRKDYTAPNGYWVLSDETRYVYDGMLVVQERYSSGVPRFAYSRGQDLSGSLQGAGGIGGMLARSSGYSSSTGGWGYNYTYHADGGGNITYAVASNGTKMAEYRYDSFGRTLSVYEQRAFTGNRYRFSSKEVHLRSGMYHYGYRFYNPSTGRWINRDPIGERGGINLYGFVGNEPLAAVDPFGKLKYVPETSFDECVHNCRVDYLQEDLAIASRVGKVVVLRLGKGTILCGVGLGVARWFPGYGKGLGTLIGLTGAYSYYSVGKAMEQADRKYFLNLGAYAGCLNNCRFKYPGHDEDAINEWE
ncbi:MAG: hypothetical protein RI897_4052 [Verrucomicrobiota bacterium]|jgi:RHS repeat-associated protein